MRIFTLASICFLAATATPGQAQTRDDQVVQRVLELAKSQAGWNSKINSAGVEVVVKEAERTATAQGTAVKYMFFLKGAPTDKLYNLIYWEIGGRPQTTLSGVTLDSSGRAICAGRPGTCGSADKPDDPIDLVMFAGKGEPKRFGLISDDQKVRAVFTLVPFPIENLHQGCRLEALLMLPDAVGVLLQGSGFASGEEVQFLSNSEGEEQKQKTKADENGEVRQAILPYVKGKESGTVTASLQGAKCKPNVSVRWGKGTYHVE